MTLVTAWIREVPNGQELVLASDSRVSGGILLNHAPKLFKLERNDAVIAYCGPTLVAYPIILQIKASLDAHQETRERIVDIVHLKSHIEKIIERLRSPIKDLPSNDKTTQSFKFLLAGYSWMTNSFKAWMFRYDILSGEFNAFSMCPRKNYIFMSDLKENESKAYYALNERIFRSQAGKKLPLDWEPLKILLSMIKDEKVEDIGGPPQILKIYKHANILPINVIWPEHTNDINSAPKKYGIAHLGRPLLEYERTRLLTLDPDTWKFIEPWKIRQHLESLNEQEDFAHRKLVIARVHDVLRALAGR